MSAKQNMKEAIREYWENPQTISIIDKNFHQIEIDTTLAYLSPSDILADIGCGDGEATVRYAKKVAAVTAIEQSSTLRGKAAAAVEREGLDNVTLEAGNVLALDYKETFDAVVTQRLIINMESWADQQQAIMSVFKALKPGGTFVMIENTNEAFQNLNEMRNTLDLAPIKQHWHNRFFDREKLFDFMEGKFQLMKEYDFSLYYFLTRVYTQMFASFEGFGATAVKEPIFEVSDRAARIVYENFKDDICFKNCISTIQAFVFRREC